MVGVTRETVSRIERKRDDLILPPRELLLHMLEAVGCDIYQRDRLLTLAGYAPELDWVSYGAKELGFVKRTPGGTHE